MPLDSLLADTGIRFRRVIVDGRYDFGHELLYAGRPRNGSPGVNLLTPLLIGRGDTAVLVNRGWVYSPNGMTLDPAPWREGGGEPAHVDGFAEQYVRASAPVSTPSEPRAVRRLDRDSIQARVPYRLVPLVIVQRADSGERAAAAANIPVRAEPPPLDEGQHRAYAVQWFGFAIVGVVGTVLVVARDRERRPGPR